MLPRALPPTLALVLPPRARSPTLNDARGRTRGGARRIVVDVSGAFSKPHDDGVSVVVAAGARAGGSDAGAAATDGAALGAESSGTAPPFPPLAPSPSIKLPPWLTPASATAASTCAPPCDFIGVIVSGAYDAAAAKKAALRRSCDADEPDSPADAPPPPLGSPPRAPAPPALLAELLDSSADVAAARAASASAAAPAARLRAATAARNDVANSSAPAPPPTPRPPRRGWSVFDGDVSVGPPADGPAERLPESSARDSA